MFDVELVLSFMNRHLDFMHINRGKMERVPRDTASIFDNLTIAHALTINVDDCPLNIDISSIEFNDWRWI